MTERREAVHRIVELLTAAADAAYEAGLVELGLAIHSVLLEAQQADRRQR